jgi:hypothetical protein
MGKMPLQNGFDHAVLLVDTRGGFDLPENVIAEWTAHLSPAPSTGMA